jgi:hypothetical protein
MVASQITLIPTPPIDELTLTDLSDAEAEAEDNAGSEATGDAANKRAAALRSSDRAAKKAKTAD